MNDISICGCCSDSITVLYHKLKNMTKDEIPIYVREEIKKTSPDASEDTINGIIDIILNPPSALSTELFKNCINFLFYSKLDKTDCTIWVFLEKYLKININTGFDYFILCYLDTHQYMEHGSGIRCGWINFDVNDDYVKQLRQLYIFLMKLETDSFNNNRKFNVCNRIVELIYLK